MVWEHSKKACILLAEADIAIMFSMLPNVSHVQNRINSSVKPEMDAVMQSRQFQNRVAAIAYCTLCGISIVVVEAFPVLHKIQYKVKLYCTPRLQELQRGSADTVL